MLRFFHSSIQGLALVFIVSTFTINAQTFSNTTVSNYNSWDSQFNFGNFTKPIAVSGLPTPLGNITGQVVLRQINLQLGTAQGTKCDLSTYTFRLTAPSGQSLDFISNPFTTESAPMWINIHFRDDASLERIRDYDAEVQHHFFPFYIGYYRVENAGSFQSVFNGANPNGNWIFSIKENSSNEISFQKIELIFGPPVKVRNVTGSNLNNNCSGSICFDGTEVIVASNQGYSHNDPNYPGNVVNGCDWNGGNNNSALFDFKAATSTAYISLSGLYSSDKDINDIQPIILQANPTCTAPTIVPTGGCPNDTNYNNKSYQTNYGGGVAPGNAYNNGITANAEFNLSGLTVGQRYYLYVDGRQGNNSSLYIEVISGLQN